MTWLEEAFNAGLKEAADTLGVAGVSPIPAAGKVQSPVISSQLGSAIPKPAVKSAVMPPPASGKAPPSGAQPAVAASTAAAIPPAPPAAVAQLHNTTETSTYRAKQSDVHASNTEGQNVSDSHAMRLAPSKSDNGELLLGNRLPEPDRNPGHSEKAINSAFDALNVQKPFDVVNDVGLPAAALGVGP